MRRGFTLLEIVVALTIAGLIALAVRATLSAGMDTEERVQHHVARTEGDARFRVLLMQALRHMTDAPAPGLAPFTMRDTLVDGVASNVVEFYSRGLAPSAGSGSAMHVRVAPAADGLTIEGRGAGGVLTWSGLAPGIRAMRARLRTPAGDWVADWPRTLQHPSAVEIEFAPKADGRTLVPLVTATALEGPP